MKRITATHASRHFSEILDRVAFRGESFVVERGGAPVCRIEPPAPSPVATVADLVDYLDTAPRPDERFARDIEDIQRRQPKLPRSPWAT